MSQVLVVRVDAKIKKLIQKITTKRGEQPSDFVRRAVQKELADLGFLDPARLKALGLKHRCASDNQEQDQPETGGKLRKKGGLATSSQEPRDLKEDPPNDPPSSKK